MLSPELLRKVRQIHIKTNHLVNASVAGSYQSAFRGKGMEFQEVRQYVPGDDVRDIDWNVTARLGEPYIKIYREERELTVMLLADMSSSGIFGSKGPLKRNLIAELAAILAFSAIKNNDNVGLILFTDHVERFILPKKGRGHVWRVIREILQFESRGEKTDIARALRFLNQLLLRRGVVFVLSDFIDPKPFQQPLTIAAKKHDLIGITIRDPMEGGLPAVGLVQLEDPESGESLLIDTRNRGLQKQLQLQLRRKNENLKQTLHRAGGHCLFVDSTQDYMKVLAAFFHQREKKR